MSAPPAEAPRAHTLNRWRRIGYRLLPGDGFSYVLHLRPAEWPIMAAHTLLGSVLALGIGSFFHGLSLGSWLCLSGSSF